MGIAAILFHGAEPLKQIANIPLTEGPMWNLVKIGQAISEKKTFKHFTILYMYTAQGQGQVIPKILMVTKLVYYLNHTL